MLPQILLTLISNPISLVAAATPFIINNAQTREARLKAEAEHRASELQTAAEISNEVCSTMDKLAYFSRQVMFGLVFRGLGTDDDKAIWKEYQQILVKWESSKTTNLAQTEMYFGADNAAALKKIQADFGTLAKQIDATHFKRKTSQWFIEDKEGSKNDFRKKFLPIWDRLQTEMTELSKEMIRQIQEEDIGSLRRE